jgi:hypothetical protein
MNLIKDLRVKPKLLQIYNRRAIKYPKFMTHIFNNHKTIYFLSKMNSNIKIILFNKIRNSRIAKVS